MIQGVRHNPAGAQAGGKEADGQPLTQSGDIDLDVVKPGTKEGMLLTAVAGGALTMAALVVAEPGLLARKAGLVGAVQYATQVRLAEGAIGPVGWRPQREWKERAQALVRRMPDAAVG